MLQIGLPYLGRNTYGELNKSPNGYNEISGIEQYNGARTRNVNIARIDILKNLDSYFNLSTIDKYRDVIYYIVAGYGKEDKKELIIKSIEELYKIDDVFKSRLGRIYYFREPGLETLSMYDAFIEDIKSEIARTLEMLNRTMPVIKVIITSKLYWYISTSPTLDMSKVEHINGLEVVARC